MIPWGYGHQMTYNTFKNNTSGVHATDTVLSQFFQRYLWQDLIGAFKWEIPDWWSYDYFTYCIYVYGFVAVINTDKFGVIPQQCGLQGYNIFYEPTHAVISSPLLKGIITPVIGKQCAIIRINADWYGMNDLVTYYADLMATACSAIGVNLINSKLAYVMMGQNKNTAETLKSLYDEIASGKPAVVMDKAALNPDGTPSWVMFNNNVGQNYITDKLLVDLEKIRNMFKTAVGIPNGNQEKKEREIVDEVNSNNIATIIAPESRLDRLKKGVEDANRIFGINLSVDWRHDPNEQNEYNNTDSVQSESESIRRNGGSQRS